MTPAEIKAFAEEKYKKPVKECRLERVMRLAAKESLINKLMIKYGHKKVNS